MRKSIFSIALLLGSGAPVLADCQGILRVPQIQAVGRNVSDLELAEIKSLSFLPSHGELVNKFRGRFAGLLPFSNERAVNALSEQNLVSCFPAFREEMQLERDLTANRAALDERQRQAQLAAREREAQQMEEDRAAQKNREKAQMMPFNILVRAYSYYIYVKHCYDKREGYAAVYINDIEMDRARNEIRAISETIEKADPSIEDSAAWKLGDGEASKHEETGENCQYVLSILDKSAKAADPTIGTTKKDF